MMDARTIFVVLVSLTSTAHALRAPPRVPPRAHVCAQLDEAALQQKLNSMRGGRGRGRGRARPAGNTRAATPRPQSPPPTASATPAVDYPAKDLPFNEVDEVPTWDVPEALRMPGSPPCTSHGHHVSLDELFPGRGLGDAWDTQASLRSALRRALRDDLFAPNLPASWSDKQREAATDLGSACMVSWRMVEPADSQVTCDRFSAAFREHGVELDGRDFLLALGGLCGQRPHGSLIEICPLPRRVQQCVSGTRNALPLADGC